MEYNKVIHGDCLIEMQKIPDKSIDMILCDLPYGTTACHWDTIIPVEPLWEQYKRIIKDNGAIVLTASQPFTSVLVMSNVKMFRYEWIWEKERPTNIFLMKKQVGKVHENILVFYKTQPTYNPQTESSKQPKNNKNNESQKGEMNVIETLGKTRTKISSTYNPEIRNPRSVLKMNRGTRGNQKLHPTQKPVALFEYLIKTYTNEGDLVLDNCAGSFTTAIASENLKRNWICIEKEAEYCAIGDKRIKENRERLLNIDNCANNIQQK
jgi:site-specific DNA-methyltransferase (adenine-specific)